MWRNKRKPITGFMCLALVMLSCRTLANELTAVEIAARADEVTVLIATGDSSLSEFGQGSGFFVSPNLIVTNFHVIEGASVIAYKRVGQGQFHSIKSIRDVEPTYDLAILEVPSTQVLPLYFGDSDTVKKGETVYVVGNPHGLEGTFSDGTLSAIRRDYTIDLLQITAPISPGSSGGPVLNGRGEVIGVATLGSVIADAQNLNFAIPSNYLKTMLRKLGVRLPPKPQSDNGASKRRNEEKAQADAERAIDETRKVEAEATKVEREAERAKAEKVKMEARRAEDERAKPDTETPKMEKAKVSNPKTGMIDRLQAATVHIYGRDRNGNEGRLGSGFFVHTNQVATDFHVVHGSTLKGVKPVGQGTQSADALLVAHLLKTDKARHLAILQVEKADVQPLPLGNSEEVDIGEKISLMEDSARGEVSEGTISDLLDKEGVRYFQFDAPVSPGGSGGPIVNSRGEVVAVTTLKVPELSGTLKYAIPAIYLKGLLAGKGDPPTLTPRPDEPKVTTTPTPHPMPPSPLLPERLLQTGIDLYEKTRFKDAIESLESAMNGLHNPEIRAEAHLYLGFAKWGLAETESSVNADFREALRYNPDVELPPRIGQNHPVFKPLLESARRELIGTLSISASPPETEIWVFGGEMKRRLLGSGNISIRLFKGNYAVEGILEGAHKVVAVLIKPNNREEISLVMPTEAPPSHEFELTLDLFSAEKPKDVKVHYTIYDASGNQLDQDKKEMQLREEKPESSTWVYHVKLPSAPQGGKIAYRIEADGKIIRDDPIQVEILEPPESAFIDINQTIPIKARVISNLEVSEVRVVYGAPTTLADTSPSQKLEKESSSNIFRGEIPVRRNHPDGATWFYVTATNNDGDKARSETRAVRTKTLSQDTPEITVLAPRGSAVLPINEPIEIKAEVKSSAPLKEVRVYYDFPRKRLSETSPSKMLENKSSSDTYIGEIPKEHNREGGYIWYFVSATTEKGVKSQTEDSVIEVKNLPTWRHEGVWASHSWSSYVQNNPPLNSDWARGDVVSLAYLMEGKGFQILGAQLDFGYENSINTSAIVQWGPRMKESAIAFAFLAGIAGYRDSDSDLVQNSNRPTQLTPLVGSSLKFYPLDRVVVDVTGSIKLRSENSDADRNSSFTKEYIHHYEMGMRIYISPTLNLKAGYGEWRIGEYNNTSVQIGLGATF